MGSSKRLSYTTAYRAESYCADLFWRCADQCLQQEVAESDSRLRAVVRLLQLLPHPQGAESSPGYGSRNRGPRVDDPRTASVIREVDGAGVPGCGPAKLPR